MPFSSLKNRKVMLVNMLYQRPSKITDYKDYLVVIYRDLITDKVEQMIIEEPEIDIYVVKPEFRTFKKARHWLKMEQCDTKRVKYKNVKYEIAKIAGGEWMQLYKTADYRDKRGIFKYPYVLGGDIDIVTYYMMLWLKECNNDIRKIPKTEFMDIEVDQIDYRGAIAKHGECEVNAISLVHNPTKTVYQFLLDNGKNPLIKDFINNQDKYQKMLHDYFDESYGELDYKIFMFTDEIIMLGEFFKLIHTLKTDFTLLWNGFGFDIPYLIARFEELRIKPASAMCSKDFPTETLYFHPDLRTFEFANKKDYFNISDYTSYVDQLILYAGLRKSKGSIKRVNLGAVASNELKDTKLDYSDIGNIRTLPYEDYFIFAAYNIKDTLLQMGIDNKCHDTENLYIISTENCVPYKDALKQTVVFRGLMYYKFAEKGIALGHNVNYDNGHGKYDENGEKLESDDDDDSFEGAINGNPLYNLANGLVVYGKRSKYLYGYTIDTDFTSMYPNSILAFNIFATTMIGKVIIEKQLMNSYDEDMGKEYIEDLIMGDVNFIGHKWHNLSSLESLDNKLKKLSKNKKNIA